MDDLKPCCPAWEKSGKSGTDNEEYNPLRYDMEMGSDLPDVNFCPWCGDVKGNTRPAPDTAALVEALRPLTGIIEFILANTSGMYVLGANDELLCMDEFTKNGIYHEWPSLVKKARAALAAYETTPQPTNLDHESASPFGVNNPPAKGT